MKTYQRRRYGSWTCMMILSVGMVAPLMALSAQEDSDPPKRDSPPRREAGRSQDERRPAETSGQAREAEMRNAPGAGREMPVLAERLRELDRRIDELNQRLDRLSGPWRRLGPGFGRGQFMRPGNSGMGGGRFMNPDNGRWPLAPAQPQPPQRPGIAGGDQRETRLQHLEAAIDNLHAAGMHEPAERLAQDLRRLRNERDGEPGSAMQPGRPGGPALEELRAEIQELRKTNQELREKLENRERDRR